MKSRKNETNEPTTTARRYLKNLRIVLILKIKLTNFVLQLTKVINSIDCFIQNETVVFNFSSMCSNLHKTILLLGGNEPNTLELFCKIRQLIPEMIGAIVKESSNYGSKPWGFEADHDFLNRVIEIETTLSPTELLKKTMQIETMLGRKRLSNSGYFSRAIDVDILFYDDIIVEIPDLTIPHPRLHLRRFTLLPLVEKWPQLRHPSLQKSMIELLKDCSDQGDVWRIH